MIVTVAARRLAPGRRRLELGAATALAVALAAPALVPPPVAAAPTVAQLVGQKLMVAMSGTTPSSGLLARIKAGQVGGVILFGSNITSAGQLRSLTNQLRAAAAAGGQPRLLIATDQEGGSVKRLPWAAPTLSPSQMASSGSATTASAQGKATGIDLGCAGINNDLAPVADVPASTSSFIYQQGRAWSFSAATTATLSDAFTTGLEAGHDIPAMKHFPGLGYATQNTDSHAVTITASKSALAPGLQPYQKAIGHHIPLIMLSNAVYTAYDSANAAGWSHAISVGLLRTTLGFTGVSITDSLTGVAAARGVSPTTLAVKAAQAGTDMILLTGSESSTASTYATLVQDAQNGTIPLSTLQASYNRILALKGTIAAPPADTTAPTVKAPTSRLYSISRLGDSSTPVRTSWSASDACGVSGYTLERRINGGTWAVQGLSSGTSTSVAQSLAFGSTYRYVARATDGAGNTSGWAYGPTFQPYLTQQNGSGVSYEGSWTTAANSYASGGTIALSTASGAKAHFRFTGFGVSWVAYRGPNRGSAKVYVDGVYRTTVNLYSSVYYARQIVYATTWSTNGTHVLTIVNLGTAGHSRVDVDGFVRLVAK